MSNWLIKAMQSGTVDRLYLADADQRYKKYGAIWGRYAYNYYHVSVARPGPVSLSIRCGVVQDPTAANGRYIQYIGDKVTVAEMNTTQGLLLSGEFSGCGFKIFQDASNRIYAAHVYRGGGGGGGDPMNSTGFETAMGWTEKFSFVTRGMVGDGVSHGWIITELMGQDIGVAVVGLDRNANFVQMYDLNYVHL